MQNNNATASLENNKESMQTSPIRITRGTTKDKVKAKIIGFPYGENRIVTTDKEIIDTTEINGELICLLMCKWLD